jgi:hypothetical protein
MFGVHLQYTIFSRERDNPQVDAGTFAEATRTTELPFPPFIGLCIDSPQLGPKQSIKSVTWKTEEQYFICDLDADYPSHDLTYEDLKEVAVEIGWTVSEFSGEAQKVKTI